MDCSLSASSPWDSPGKNTGVDRFSLLQRLFPTQGSNLDLCHYRWILYHLSHPGIPKPSWKKWKCSHCHVCLFVTTWTVACQVPLSMGFSRQEYWSWSNLPDPGIEPRSPTFHSGSLPSEQSGKANKVLSITPSTLFPLPFSSPTSSTPSHHKHYITAISITIIIFLLITISDIYHVPGTAINNYTINNSFLYYCYSIFLLVFSSWYYIFWAYFPDVKHIIMFQ